MSEGRRYAILIGSSRFDNEPKLNPLKCPERDVDGMREILAAAELGAFGETFVFKDAENHAVLRRIEEVLADATRDDQVLIYYSGHGETDLPGRLYLATTNTEVRRLVSTSIPVETLRLFIENSSCRKIMLILDCCYGGAVGRSFSRGSVDEKLKELARGSGVYILTASTASQTAQEREGDDYGLLTKHIISGIKQGEADVNDDGFVSMDDLYSYVFAKVKSEGYQEPMRWALNVKGEDLIIARASGTPGRERQRLLNEKVIEFRDFLPRQIFLKALQVIDERQAPFYGLIDELYRQRLQIGKFIEEWYRLESIERPQPLLPTIPQPQQGDVAGFRRRLLTANTYPELLRLQHEIDAFLKENPGNVEALLLKDEVKSVIRPVRAPDIVYMYKEALSPTPGRVMGPASSPMLISRRRLLFISLAAAVALIALLIWIMLKNQTNSGIRERPTQHSTQKLDSLPALSSAAFETVMLDAQGKEKSRRTLQAEYFTESLGDSVTLEMVRIPSGEFIMGSPESEAQRVANEGPQHSVRVPEFFMGRVRNTRDYLG